MSSLRLALVPIVLSAVFTAAGGLEAAEGAEPAGACDATPAAERRR
ncbi:MAG TPA: hypothetical protein VIK51_16405 [Vicinamibacteria bacterium]|jgi:hypothetical protein